MKKIISGILAASVMATLAGCVNQEANQPLDNNQVEPQTKLEEQKEYGTAGSNIPLKDNFEEAEYQIKVAVQNWLEETYGSKVFDARIYVDKIYTAEEEESIEPLKERNLNENEVAFEVSYELKPSDEEYVFELTVPDGVYDEETGWITEISRLGILRPNDDENSEQKYKITDFGTGW